MNVFSEFLKTTGPYLLFDEPEHWLNFVMILIGVVFIFLAIRKDYEPLLLLPIGFGIIVGNMPFVDSMPLSVYDDGGVSDPSQPTNLMQMSVMSIVYFGVKYGLFPPLIFLGIGAMTDFSTMLSNPKLVLLGAAAQIGVFLTLLGALFLGFTAQEAGAIGIIGGADGPTAIFLSARLAPHYLGPIAIAAYSYMALVPVIQPPIMKLLTTREERLIKMKPPREVSQREKMIFPVVAFFICVLIAPGAMVLLGMLFFGNLMKESGVTDRLAATARTSLIDMVTILLGFAVGASTKAQYFLRTESLMIFALGATSFAIATAGGLLFAKFMNLFLEEKINPLVGAAGVSAVPDSARVVQMVGQKEDPHNFLLMHAMAPNVAGVIGSAVAAGVLWSVLPPPTQPVTNPPAVAAPHQQEPARSATEQAGNQDDGLELRQSFHLPRTYGVLEFAPNLFVDRPDRANTFSAEAGIAFAMPSTGEKQRRLASVCTDLAANRPTLIRPTVIASTTSPHQEVQL